MKECPDELIPAIKETKHVQIVNPSMERENSISILAKEYSLKYFSWNFRFGPFNRILLLEDGHIVKDKNTSNETLVELERYFEI